MMSGRRLPGPDGCPGRDRAGQNSKGFENKPGAGLSDKERRIT